MPAAAADEQPPCHIDRLTDELLALVLDHLDGGELCRFGSTGRRWQKLTSEPGYWQKLLREKFGGLGARLQSRSALSNPAAWPARGTGGGGGSCSGESRRLKQVYQLSKQMRGTGTSVEWSRARLRNSNRPQEGHSACLLNDRWMVVVGGYGGGIVNDVTVLDTYLLPESPVWASAEVCLEAWNRTLAWMGTQCHYC